MEVRNRSRGGRLVARVRWCSTFLCRLRGLSLQPSLAEGDGLVLVEGRAGRWSAAIHMLGMRFDLGVVWIDGQGRVVDVRQARPWRVYVPSAPARFTLETDPGVVARVAEGEEIDFVEAAPG